MGNDVASISLTRDTWRVLFMSQIAYLYSIVFDRQQQSPGSEKWLQLDATLKEGLRTFMPALKEASTQSTALGKMWFELKRDAGFFLDEASEDLVKQVVVFE